ncbi:hypothetical protein M3P21_08825 [Ruegeria sp. 2012CJ41-6]|uniref:DUF4156 domain-containing protein n=1 Tax=Ruegeria spongiae TaxID=2942209 RepID=A0ABT0Q392_9RHOB|nr:hypothetical protein [Ruegeria spongiae]MCL6283633.1 hypothetical protein [Ruegeria spongiae]
MKKAIAAILLTATVAACTEPVIQTGASYPAVAPEQVKVSFAATPNCTNAQEIGLIPQVGSNKYSQTRAINEIKRQAASRGANLVLLETRATSLLGDMLIDAEMYRCM